MGPKVVNLRRASIEESPMSSDIEVARREKRVASGVEFQLEQNPLQSKSYDIQRTADIDKRTTRSKSVPEQSPYDDHLADTDCTVNRRLSATTDTVAESLPVLPKKSAMRATSTISCASHASEMHFQFSRKRVTDQVSQASKQSDHPATGGKDLTTPLDDKRTHGIQQMDCDITRTIAEFLERIDGWTKDLFREALARGFESRFDEQARTNEIINEWWTRREGLCTFQEHAAKAESPSVEVQVKGKAIQKDVKSVLKQQKRAHFEIDTPDDTPDGSKKHCRKS